ncbi:MAG: hypothetical protein Q8M06_08445 [Methanobacteriaceae archaeon]|nr:hypothetical protein [Methanobacteriaceae archaeon]MDZ4171983.1 hypothetical protein [Methanobacteriaceae archaeon]
MELDLTITIAIYAALVSTSVLVWNIYIYYLQNHPRLKVEVKYGYIMTTESVESLMIHVSNRGKTKITISSVGFELNQVKGNISVFQFLDKNLPVKLQEGESHTFNDSFPYIKKQLEKLPKESRIPKYVWVEDQSGKKYKSKDISKIPEIYKKFK